MKRELQLTDDGSHTISIPEMQVTYHSTHGAIQESMHVFIQAGLQALQLPAIRIFEMGFGTGLNALLTMQHATTPVYYYAVEQYPLTAAEVEGLSYGNELHGYAWNVDVQINEWFTLHKAHASLLDVQPAQAFDLIYYDAFAPATQPELWTKEVFEKLYGLLDPGGILVTYCSKGDVRRAMLAAGFGVEKLAGPPGKREMLRAQRQMSQH
ncbi:tRNA (5-methylaminomethyl-2-thiouridine)(34)-methyltransferase MnmD [Chitinophaga sancti]|uniref:tRNA (5-methylaminomethyl-2-thiouridine)(34)-methyltransferase MnmD n=1 Tax=Chitinophaga sancti TaxID=1004 RepID=UPI003F7A5DD6